MASRNWIFPELNGIACDEARGLWWPTVVFQGLPEPGPFPCEPAPGNADRGAWARWNGRSRAQRSVARDWLERLGRAQHMLGRDAPGTLPIIVDPTELAWVETVRREEFQKAVAAWETDPAAARDHLEEAALNGHPEAQYRFALLCDQGLGGPQDQGAARRWHREAARAGVLPAMNDYAWMCAHGEGGAADPAEALAHMTAAAEAGLVMAQDNLAAWYREGVVGAKDLAAARTWYRRAAEQGLATCQEWLGIFQVNGWGGPQEGQEALLWFERAAKGGQVDSWFFLFLMHLEGVAGLPVDRDQAFHWMRIALEAGSPKARQWVAEHS